MVPPVPLLQARVLPDTGANPDTGLLGAPAILARLALQNRARLARREPLGQAKRPLMFERGDQRSGCTEPLLHAYRARTKQETR